MKGQISNKNGTKKVKIIRMEAKQVKIIKKSKKVNDKNRIKRSQACRKGDH